MSAPKTMGSFQSSDGSTKLRYIIWTPEAAPRMVLQIVPDIQETLECYEIFASYFSARGIVVCAAEQLGFCDAVCGSETEGHFGDTDGDLHLIDDVDLFHTLMRKHYRRLPYVMLGCGLGSVVLRCYLTRYPNSTVTGALLVGTCFSAFAKKGTFYLAGLIRFLRGSRYRSSFLNRKVFGKCTAGFSSKEPGSWICADRSGAYLGNTTEPYGMKLTTTAYRDLLRMMLRVSEERWPADVPHRLSLLFISGEKDPMGDFGRGIRMLCASLDDAEINALSLKLYAKSCHAVLFDGERHQVWKDILDWLEDLRDAAIRCDTMSNENLPAFLHPPLRWEDSPEKAEQKRGTSSEDSAASKEGNTEEKAFPLQGKMWL